MDLDALSLGELREKDSGNWDVHGAGWNAIASGFGLGDFEGSFTFNTDEVPDVSADGALFGSDDHFTFDPTELTHIYAPEGGSLL